MELTHPLQRRNFLLTLIVASSITYQASRSFGAPSKGATGFEQWKKYIDDGVKDANWHKWDCEIQAAVTTFNDHLSGSAGYLPLDWRLIKAILWVETGAGSAAWNTKPMQIGVANDPGLRALLSGKEGGELILPPSYQTTLSHASARTHAAHNIRAGIAYLLMRMARYAHQTQASADSDIKEVTVQKGDNFSTLARKYGSTTSHLQALNLHTKILKIGQTVKVQKAKNQKVIASWRKISPTLIHSRYNGFGDPNYAKKLNYVLPYIQQESTTQCPSSTS